MQTFLMISFGAILGANCRYWLGDWVARQFGAPFPFGTLLINLLGSFVLGMVMVSIVDRILVDPRWRMLLVVGFLGSYTTFSSYTYESVTLILEGQFWPGILYLFGSSLLGGLAVLVGISLGRVI